MIIAPLTMLVIVRPLVTEFGRRVRKPRQIVRFPAHRRSLRRVAWSALAVVFIAGAVWSTFLALRDAPVGPPGPRGAAAGVPADRPRQAGALRRPGPLRRLRPARRRHPRAAGRLPRRQGLAERRKSPSTPATPTRRSTSTPSTAAPSTASPTWSPAAAPGTARRRRTSSGSRRPPTSSSGNGPGRRRATATCCSRAPRRAPAPTATRPRCGSCCESGGKASLFGETTIGTKPEWSDGSILGNGETTSQTLELPKGTWDLSLQYFSPFALSITAPGFKEELIAALDGQRPNTISLNNNGQFWPAGKFQSTGGKVEFTIHAAPADWFQSLTGCDAKAYIGEIVATKAEPHQTVPLSAGLRPVDRLVRKRPGALRLDSVGAEVAPRGARRPCAGPGLRSPWRPGARD